MSRLNPANSAPHTSDPERAHKQMKLAVIGANGKVGSLLCQKAANVHQTTAFIRSSEQKSKFEAMGVQVSLAIDITNTSLAKVTEVLKGYDAVVYSAGAAGKGLDLTFSVDLDGAVKVAEAVKANGINRFVLVSAILSDDRDFWWNMGIRSYYIAKKYADMVIPTLGVNYTIVQPGVLLDTPGTGKVMDPTKVNAFARGMQGDPQLVGIPREDVANVIMESLGNEHTVDKFIPLLTGDIPIGKALELV